MDHYYQSIQGWFDYQDLYTMMVKEAPSNAVFVEVGVWKGKSAAYMAVEIYNSGKDIKLCLVDHFKGSSAEVATTHKEATTTDIEGVARTNLARREFKEIVNFIPRPSREAVQRFDNESVDFVFIDAGHTHEEVFEDVAMWYPKVRPGGFIAGHDYNREEVETAVKRVVPAYRFGRVSWIYKKDNEQS